MTPEERAIRILDRWLETDNSRKGDIWVIAGEISAAVEAALAYFGEFAQINALQSDEKKP